MDVAHLYRNVGIGGVLRGLGVWLVMLGLSVHLVARDGQIAPMVTVTMATIVPMLLRRWLVARLDTTVVVLRYGGYALLAICVSSAAWMDRIGSEPEVPFVTALVGIAALYCAAWFAVFSDPTVLTERARSRRDAT